MKDVEKFKSFSELKKAEQASETVTYSDDVKHFLELLRKYAIPVESKADRNAE